MDQHSKNEVLRASLRLSPVGTPVAELAATGEAQELVIAWSTGHPGGTLSLKQASKAGQYDALRLTDAEVAAIRGSSDAQ